VIGFAALSLVMIASAIFTVTARKPVYSVVGLLVNFIALAATYLMLQAEFLAVIQIVVYSGAILVLFVFVIALLSSGVKPFDIGPDLMPKIRWPALAFALVAVAGIVAVVVRGVVAPHAVAGQTGDANVFGSVADFGNALFLQNILPFEVTAFILMVAVIGVVLLAGDESPGRRAPRRPREPIVKPREPIAR
jgi:NADH-quinone oxidoreductase subunit J